MKKNTSKWNQKNNKKGKNVVVNQNRLLGGSSDHHHIEFCRLSLGGQKQLDLFFNDRKILETLVEFFQELQSQTDITSF